MPIKGFVEALRPFQVRGWASDDQQPELQLPIYVRVDGCPTVKGLAALFRDDLLAAGIGDGRHGFIINTDTALPIHRPNAIVVEAVSQDGRRQELTPIPGFVVESEAHASLTPLDASSREQVDICGFFAPKGNTINGWAFDPANPSLHLNVSIERDGRSLGRTTASKFKDDLLRAGIGYGDHGFVFNIPLEGNSASSTNIAVFAITAGGNRHQLRLATAQPVVARAQEKGPSFPGATTDNEQFPVIVLGAARSGTSAMAQALTASGVYEGFEEGHFLDLIMPLLQTSARFYESRAEEWSTGRGTQISSIPQSFVDEGLRHIFIQATRASYPSGRWIDKTPRVSMVGAVITIRDIWPNTRFVYMRRRAIENLESRLRKFPGMDFEAACQEWALSIQGWNAVVSSLGSAVIEIDQVFMATHPAYVAGEVARFLDLDGEALARIEQALEFDLPERTAAAFGAVLDLRTVGWSDQQLETFRAICVPAMASVNYAEDASYFRDGNAQYGLIVR